MGARAPVSASVRKSESLPGNPSGSGTGINPWWEYQEQNVPRGAHVMVSVGTGNLILQDDDMSVPHKGIAMAFRRTYNSQSLHDVNGDDGSFPGMYGNGWTSTFDAHLTGANGTIDVWDIDGAKYVYTLAADGVTWQSMTPGQHATMTSDGSCGMLWTKKTGTTYYFWDPYQMPSCNISFSAYGGYAGRLADIIGRNSNVLLAFTYAWDGQPTATGKINGITVTTESGMTAKLTFTDVNGHRLLEQLTFPDNSTSVTYGYDANGNLLTVLQPPNNSSGTRPVEAYAYGPVGSSVLLTDALSPRYYAGCATTCGSDGEQMEFGYAGTSAASSTVSSIVHYGVVDPSVPDGLTSFGVPAGPLQSGFASNAFIYLTEYYTSGVLSSSYSDTDGHMMFWSADTSGRISQTQLCTASTGQGTTCTGQLLTTKTVWDTTNNNRIADYDTRGNRTDYAFDANGNTTAVAQPAVTVQTASGNASFRPIWR